MLVLFILSIVAAVFCLYMSVTNKEWSGTFFGGGVFFILVSSFLIFGTGQGQLYWAKFTAGYEKGTWIIVDNSGGETMRHWVLFNGYVKGGDQTDGWEFTAENCSPCYVGGDSFVGKITKELANGNYKEVFNIPQEQKTLH